MASAYLLDIIYLLAAAVIIVPGFQAIRLGAVPGFVVAGVIVGPHGLGLISNLKEFHDLAEIGVVFLLFVIGIELKPSRLWQMRRYVFGAGVLQFLGTSVVLGLLLHYLFGMSINHTLLIAPALSLSSTAFVLQLMAEKKMLTTQCGRMSLSVLLLQDLAVVPLLALVPLLAMDQSAIGIDIGLALGQSTLILASVVLVGRYLLHPILHRVALSGNPEVFTASAVLIVLGTAMLTEHAGLSMAMGAFLAGMLISDSTYKHQVLVEIQPFRGILLGFFFMSMGTLLNVNLMIEDPIEVVAAVLLLMMIKATVLFPVAWLFRLKIKNAIATALLLSQSGEFALVLFTLAYQSALLESMLYQQLLVVVLLSMLATPFFAQMSYRLIQMKEINDQVKGAKPTPAPVVIAGFGRVGRRIGEIFSIAGETYVALDSDPVLVENGREQGHPVFYGDVRNPELLKLAGASDAKVIVVTLNDPEATMQLVTTLREVYPGVAIYARGHSMSECLKLREAGATGTVSENVEASLELAHLALSESGLSSAQRDHIMDGFRKKYRAQIEAVMDLEDKSSWS